MTDEGKCEVCGFMEEDRSLHIHQLHTELKRLREAVEIVFSEWAISPARGLDALPQLFETMESDRKMELIRRRAKEG